MSGAAPDANIHKTPNQPGIIYAFDGDNGDEIREITRSGHGEIGPSPGDVIQRDDTKSNPTERLPRLDLPGQEGTKRDDCGEDIPAFACSECGSPKYIGRTCYSPGCDRCWPAAVKRKIVRGASKLEGLRKRLYAKYDGKKQFDFNHVVASLPTFKVDSDEPEERALLALKTLLEEKWGVEGFYAIYHPYRIKQEYRKDQYDHGGEQGDGDMTWKDVLNAENPEQYIYFSPHFHLFFPAVRKSFDYMTAEAVEDESGWLFKRITKQNSNISVSDLDDLVHQMTYCLSHAGVWTDENGVEMETRMKGLLHNTYAPDGAEDRALASLADAAPKLLGYKFANTKEGTCDEELPADTEDDHPHEHANTDDGSSNSGGSTSNTSTTETTPCGGDLVPMSDVQTLLNDDDWRKQARHADALETAHDEWQRLKTELDDWPDLDGPPPDHL